MPTIHMSMTQPAGLWSIPDVLRLRRLTGHSCLSLLLLSLRQVQIKSKHIAFYLDLPQGQALTKPLAWWRKTVAVANRSPMDTLRCQYLAAASTPFTSSHPNCSLAAINAAKQAIIFATDSKYTNSCTCTPHSAMQPLTEVTSLRQVQ